MLFFILFIAVSLFAQESIPTWIQDEWRSARYPKSEWYTGFVMDKINKQPDLKTYQEMEKTAQNKLSESIVVNIQGTSSVENTNVQQQNGKNRSEAITRNYNQAITTASNTVLAKMEIHSYFDKKTSRIYAFAAVRKKDLADFYRANINSLFSFAEKEFTIAEYLAEQGKKNSAFGKIRAIEDSLKNVSYWGSYLQTVDGDNSYIRREKELWQRINNAKMSLENSTSVYIDVSGIEEPEDFTARLSTYMQEKQCNCAMSENENDADYVVQVKAKLNRCMENKSNKYGEVYCYASANVSVNSPKYKRPLEMQISEAKGGWMNGNKDKATEEAFKELSKNIAEKIIQTMNK